MAPNKRTIKEAAPAPQMQVKKAKKHPMAQKLNEITRALQSAALTDEVKDMLTDILPCSLGEFSDQRGKFQEQVVESIACILAEVDASLNKGTHDARAQRDTAGSEKPLRDKDAQETTANLELARTNTQRVKAVLAEKALAFRAATASLADANEARNLDAQKSQEAAKQKGHLEIALEDLIALKAMEPKEGDADKKQDKLVACLKKYKFEESILIALPAALGKAPDSRGQFDLMAIALLEDEINKKLAAQESILIAARPGQEECEDVVRNAHERLHGARAEQRVAAKNYDTANKEEADCEMASNAALKAVLDMTISSKRLEKAVFDAEVKVEVFQAGPMAAFDALRQRASLVPAQVVEEVMLTGAGMVEDQVMEAQEHEVPAVAAC